MLTKEECAIDRFYEKYHSTVEQRQAVRKLVKEITESEPVIDVTKINKKNESDASTLLVLNSVWHNPKPSIRKRAQNFDISKSWVQNIIR